MLSSRRARALTSPDRPLAVRMSDAFFTNPRPFTKRKREDGPNAKSDSRRGTPRGRGSSSRGDSRGASRGGARGGRGGDRGGRGRGGDRGRGRGGRGAARGGRGGAQEPKGKRRADEDEELDEPEDGFESEDDEELEDAEEFESDEDETETPAQKRLRLSQMYLKSLEKEARPGQFSVEVAQGGIPSCPDLCCFRPDDGGFDAADLDRDLIAERLQQDVVRPSFFIHPLSFHIDPFPFQLEHTGKLHLNVADSVRSLRSSLRGGPI